MSHRFLRRITLPYREPKRYSQLAKKNTRKTSIAKRVRQPTGVISFFYYIFKLNFWLGEREKDSWRNKVPY